MLEILIRERSLNDEHHFLHYDNDNDNKEDCDDIQPNESKEKFTQYRYKFDYVKLQQNMYFLSFLLL